MWKQNSVRPGLRKRNPPPTYRNLVFQPRSLGTYGNSKTKKKNIYLHYVCRWHGMSRIVVIACQQKKNPHWKCTLLIKISKLKNKGCVILPRCVKGTINQEKDGGWEFVFLPHAHTHTHSHVLLVKQCHLAVPSSVNPVRR